MVIRRDAQSVVFVQWSNGRLRLSCAGYLLPPQLGGQVHHEPVTRALPAKQLIRCGQ